MIRKTVARDKANKAVETATTDAANAAKAEKAAEAVLAAITVREDCVVPSNPAAKPGSTTKPSAPAAVAGKSSKGTTNTIKVVNGGAVKGASKAQSGLAKTGADSLAAIAAATVLLGAAGTGLAISRRND